MLPKSVENWEEQDYQREEGQYGSESRGKEKAKTKRLVKEKDTMTMDVLVRAEADNKTDVVEIVKPLDVEGFDTLPMMNIVSEEKNEIEFVSEEREINKADRVEYLKIGLVPDMKAFYGLPGVDKKEATIRLDKFGVKTVYRSPTDKRKDYKFGNELAKKLEEFLAIKSGFPKGWRFYGENLSALGIDINELQEARSTVTTEKIVEKTKRDDVKKEVKGEVVPEEMSLEDKMKMVGDADYGGSLFPAFKKYVSGEALPVGLEIENVMSQVGKLFPFDVRKFAGEMRSRRENIEKPVVEWEGKYKNDPMFNTLKQVVDDETWQKKMEELSVLDELTRDNELMILMALIRIKSEGMTTVEAWRLWDSQKSKLEELGLML